MSYGTTIKFRGQSANQRVANWVKRNVSSYKKHSCVLVESPRVDVHEHSLRWDGGSRSYYTQYPLRQPLTAGEYHLVDGECIVSSGTFCGKPSTLYVYATANTLKALTERGTLF